MQVLDEKQIEAVSGGDNPGMGDYGPAWSTGTNSNYCYVGGPYGGSMWQAITCRVR